MCVGDKACTAVCDLQYGVIILIGQQLITLMHYISPTKICGKKVKKKIRPQNELLKALCVFTARADLVCVLSLTSASAACALTKG